MMDWRAAQEAVGMLVLLLGACAILCIICDIARMRRQAADFPMGAAGKYSAAQIAEHMKHINEIERACQAWRVACGMAVKGDARSEMLDAPLPSDVAQEFACDALVNSVFASLREMEPGGGSRRAFAQRYFVHKYVLHLTGKADLANKAAKLVIGYRP